MSGINLSQSIQEKQALAQVKFFDKGLITSIVVVVLLAALAVGVHWYANKLETKMTELDALVAQKTAGLKSQEIDQLVDFSDRLDAIERHFQTETNPTDILQIIEGNTLATLRLSGFQYNHSDGTMSIEGEAGSLKEIAQQMLVFKRLESVEDVHVETIGYGKSGTITFSIKFREKAAHSRTSH